MVREAVLLDYVPDFYKKFLEMRTIQESIQPEIQILIAEAGRLMGNQFILDVDEEGIRLYESTADIRAMDDDTIENRRFVVMSKWNRYAPYTKSCVVQKLTALCGADGYTLKITSDKKLIVRVELASKKNYDEVEKLLDGIVPCDMVIDLNLLYNQHGTLKRFTHRQLSEWTHKYIRNEVLPSGN